MKLSLKYRWIHSGLVIALTIAIAMLGPVADARAVTSDVPSTWAQAEIDDARTKGLIIEEADQDFQVNISRRLFCALVVNMTETILGQPVNVTIANPFGDTNESEILKAYQLGLVYGISSSQFAPEDSITREQIAAMMMRAAHKLDQLKGSSYAVVTDPGTAFSDQGEISAWALADVRSANRLGIMQGIGGNRIGPQGNTTVEQAILFINRLNDGFTTFTASSSTPPPTPAPTPTNLAPTAIANPVAFSTPEQTDLLISPAQLARDPEGQALEIVAVNGQTGTYNTLNGTVKLSADGGCVYRSGDISVNVTDDFAVTVSDGTNQTHINVRVNATYQLVLITNLTPALNSVTITGPAAMNESLRVKTILYVGGTPSPAPQLTYQWLKSSSAAGVYTVIPGETANTLALTAQDVGNYLKLRVSASGSVTGTVTSNVIGPIGYGFAGGDGTAGNPYQISNAAQFMLLDTVPSGGKYFELVSDISLAQNQYIHNTFYGTLDGQGHAVNIDLLISTPGKTEYLGAFARIGRSTAYAGKIMNLEAAGSIRPANSEVRIDYAGGITGYNQGVLSYCKSAVDITANVYVGGIAGANSKTIEYCATEGSQINGYTQTGGLIGWNFSPGTVWNCYTQTNVSGSGCHGGLIGSNEGAVRYCYSAGPVAGIDNPKGGLIGKNWTGGVVEHCYYDLQLSGTNDSDRGIPRTTSQMHTQGNYYQWDFISIWNTISGNYPTLR